MSTARERRIRARARARWGIGVATKVISNQWVSNQFREITSDYCLTDY
jgi:hypothetical protein